jgi:outer membrane protein assembly complex protein YaeT
MRLIYSMNLADSQDQIWVAEYDVTKRFRARGIKQEDNSYRTEFRHDLRFGGPPEAGQMTSAKPREKKEVGTIKFLGNPIFSEERLANKLKLKTGDKYDFFKLQKGRDRLEGFYAKEGRLEASVRVDRQPEDHAIDLKFNITAGPKVDFIFEGWKVSGGVKDKIKKLWEEGIFDAQRAEEALRVIRDPLVDDDYLQARIDYEIQSPAEDLKRVIFTIDPGVRYQSVKLLFEGASAIEPAQLEGQFKEAKLTTKVYTDPSKVVDRLTRFYQQQGYLDAKVQLPRYELDPPSKSGRVIIPVQEGPLFKIGKVTFNGNSNCPSARLQESAGISVGQSYEPRLLDRSLSRLEDLYRRNGYTDVVINFARNRDSNAGLVDISFQITENRQSIVQEIKIEGNDQTSEKFVQRRLRIRPGDALDYHKINRSRKNLYDAGVYSLVDFEVQSAEGTAASTEDQKRKPVLILLKLKEVKPYQIRYGAFFDTERGPGISADISDRNFLGNARTLGTSLRYDGQLKEARGYFNQPFLGRYRIKSTGYTFLRREIEPTFITDRIGFSFQQEAQLREKFIFTYGYTYERAHTFDRNPDPDFPFDITVPIARLTGTLTREKRDDLLDATRGSFLSQSIEFAPGQLASQVRFVRYFGQYFKYFPLNEPSPVPFSGGLQRSRLVYATGIRVGLAKGLSGQEVIRSERFFAGGGTTLRGFKQDTVGPVDPLGNPAGGNAVVILNNEIRFPMFSIFDGVGFLDLGNVYPKVTDFNPWNIRKSAGFGLRLRTPFLLLRLDYGVKLDRKPGESFGDLFFSIGQAF